jgi:type I restriction enzyme, S subunit
MITNGPGDFPKAWKRAFDNFEQFLSTPENIPRMRNTILELAIRGRLLQQHSEEEETAQLLLEKVAAERGRLIQIGTLKPSKPREEAEAQEEPFSLPTGWAWARIGDLFDVSGGIQKTPKRAPVENHYPYLRVENVQRGHLDLSRIERFELAEGELDRWRLVPGDLLIVEGNGSETEIGRCALWDGSIENCVHQNHLIRCRPISPFDSHFTLLFFNSPSGKAEMKALAITTSGLYSLSVGKIRGIMVPVPPLKEQKRIVTKVDQLMALCDELEARQTKKRETGTRLTQSALEALTSAEGPEAFTRAWQRVADNFDVLLTTPASVDTVRKSVLELAVRGRLVRQDSAEESAHVLLEKVAAEKASHIQKGSLKPSKSREGPEAAEDPFCLPAGWAWARIGDIFDVSGGIQKTPKRTPINNHYPYLRVENVQRGRLDLSRIERFELAEGELDRWRLVPGDLLIVEGNGSETEIGRCALWDGSIENCVHQNHLIRCRPINPFDSQFTLLFLNSPSGMAEMKELAITTSGLYSLSVGKIRGIMVPVPPLKEQKRIIAKMSRLLALCDTLDARLRYAEQGAQRLAESMAAAMVA